MTAGAVLVMGAGSVGCYVGGSLAAAGVSVTLVGRPRVLDAVAQHGLAISDLDGAKRGELAPGAFHRGTAGRYRRCLAALIDEAVAALDAAGIAPAQLAAVPARRLPTVLRLPNWLFRIVAARRLRIDAKARYSMADDLALGRRTEVNGVWPKPSGRFAPERLCALLGL